MAVGSDKSHRFSYGAMTSPLPTSHLLEVTLISAQDLHRTGRWMQAYAVAWVHPDRKLRTRIDTACTVDPNWNDKFVFRVDDTFLKSATSSFTVDIFSARHLRRYCLVGTVRVVVSSIAPSPSTRFVALQVRRPKSLRPQGIINIGVALVDAYIPFVHDSDCSSAFMLKDLASSPVAKSMPLDMGSDRSDYSGALRKGSSLGRNRSVNVGKKQMEQEAEELESKLEKWRLELSPAKEWDRPRSKTMTRQTRRSMSCFSCTGVRD